MPSELIATAPRTPAFRDYEDLPLEANQIRVRTELASPKHGTELVMYRGDPVAMRRYDAELGAMMPSAGDVSALFPMRLGNMAVGTVMEIGPEVTRFRPGDRVFGHFPIRETQTVEETRADPLPDGLTAEAALCLDPAVMALPMRDAGVGLGDRVAVFGLGAIGLMAVQLARLAGADWVVAVDPIAHRREVALALGADAALDPSEADGDAGLTIRRLTSEGPRPLTRTVPSVPVVGGYRDEPSQSGQLGVDVAVECSGNSQALHQAIRATRFGGAVAVVSFYGREASGLHLGAEFHINQLALVSVRAQSLPLRDNPGWDLRRLVEVALAWLASGRLRADGILTPIVPFDQAVEAYREIDEHPERSIKLGIRFPSA
ncbi:MAG: zinc-binding alcohol dehydrogenase [Chloroflexota bacterium]|nr:zinc-binding alcohol dehydrogenase [Chloroflexota bacterium]